jgi:peptidoglycan/LPS O-acetylase OafA/YrhL
MAFYFGLWDFKSGEPPLFQALLVPQAWALSLELMFYLIASWLFTSKRKILTVFALSVLARGLFFILGFGLEEPWDYRFFPTELAFSLRPHFSPDYRAKSVPAPKSQ